MKKFTLLLLFVATVGMAKDYGLHFDDRGNIIKPDQHYLWKGIDDEKDGFRQSAFKNFKKAAEFGNFHAMSLVALYYMQDQDYLQAHAWFNLIDLAKIPNRAYIEEIVGNLEQIMSKDQLKNAQEMKGTLAETYGAYPTLLRREEWKKNMKFTGTHIKGYIPNFLRIQLNSGAVVTGSDLKEQMEKFIYEYEFSFGQGEVTLDEIELIEVDEDAAKGADDNEP
ncbi:hypothetical protein [Marinicella meishanensis]|uniref:hypothetical protein n=1 Tax=Marinicella meishanensis TaxID=2873263 RepID=UPI001CC010BC|nr:hypothetical protein [Marinicella sp. NBU2979]